MSHDIVAELRHEIHSPLAAIRNALYLIAVRTEDFKVLEYVKLAEEEAKQIAGAFGKVARQSRKGQAA